MIISAYNEGMNGTPENSKEKRVLFLFWLFFAGSEIIKQILLTSSKGFYDVWYFPFQLCSMPIYLLPFALLLPEEKGRSIGGFLADYSLLGGVMVFLDQSGLHYDLPVLTIHSYLWHILLIILGLYIRRKKIRSSFWEETKIFLLLVIIAEFINFLFREMTNMFYVSLWMPMGQIVFRDIAVYTGNTVSILLYILSIILGAFFLHKTGQSS